VPTAHWIVTNRAVDRGTVVDRVHEPRPTFRVAKFNTPGAASPSDGELAGAVEFVPDSFFDDYEDLRDDPDADPSTLPGTKQLFLALYGDMRDSTPTKGDTLFFIHGFNFSWPDSLRHLHTLDRLYVRPASSPISRIVYFSWPSFGELFRYKSDQQIAQPCGYLLGRLYTKVIQFYKDFFGPADGGTAERPKFCGRRVHLAAHSMGNQVLQEFVRGIRDYPFLRVPVFGEVVMLNADAGWSCLEPRTPLYDLPEFCGRITAYNHNSDDALLVSETTKNSEKRLGRHGPRDLDLIAPRTAVVDCSKLDAGRAPAMDRKMCDVCESSLEILNVPTRERLGDHWGYLSRKEVITDIHRVLRGESQSGMGRFREAHGRNLYRLVDG
jgi:esterase/lipase superfamily enzyme